jgi:proteasome lid subunit RPN8/RPN11
MNLKPHILDDIRTHAAEAYPRECCGVVNIVRGRQVYQRCANVAEKNEHFVIDTEYWSRAEDLGEIVLIVHSHPNTAPQPSQADLVGIERSGLPWLIVNHPVGHYTITEPTGYQAPLIGREFVHGMLDCYTLIRDYYQRELGIEIKDYNRPDEWWKKGLNLYRDGFEDADFVEVSIDTLRAHDVLLMKVGDSGVENHGAIFLGTSNHFLHHPMNRLSSRDVFGGYWRKITTAVVRHRSLL